MFPSVHLVLFILITFTFLVYKYITRNNNHWKIRGIPYVKPIPIFGNFLDVLILRTTLANLLREFYNQFDEPFFGIFILDKPHLIVKSPDIIKSILIKDFNHFQDRNLLYDKESDHLSSNMLFFLKSTEWKCMRSKLSPAFTLEKNRNMFPLIVEVSKSMKTYINNNLNQTSLESKEICSKYATDVITSFAFGLEANSFDNDKGEFREVGRQMFDFRLTTAFRQMSYIVAPSIAKAFRIPFLDSKSASFLRNVFWKMIENRELIDHKRNDLIDIIKDLQKSPDFQLDGDGIVAQAVQFFVAGFETISATMAFTLYELCIHPEIQNKLREEIAATLEQYKVLSHDVIQSMTYLDMVVYETLRKYPALPFLERMTTRDYQLPSSKITIEKGTPVFIPLLSLHTDPKYFPEPERYDPERFSSENKNNLYNSAYIPFGNGPRSCIGKRLGLIVVKTGLVHIFSEFEVVPSANTPIPIKYEKKTFLLASDVGLPMKYKKINHLLK